MSEPLQDNIPRLTYIIRTSDGQTFHTEPTTPQYFADKVRATFKSLKLEGLISQTEKTRLSNQWANLRDEFSERLRELILEEIHFNAGTEPLHKRRGRPADPTRSKDYSYMKAWRAKNPDKVKAIMEKRKQKRLEAKQQKEKGR